MKKLIKFLSVEKIQVENLISQEPIEKLLRKRNWDQVLERIIRHMELNEKTTCEDTILHSVCRNYPPVRVVNRLLIEFSWLASQLNEEKQTPLHVAAACGASPKVVAALVKHCPESSEWQDNEGCTPLHLHLKYSPLCDAGYMYQKEDNPTLIKGPMMQILEELVEAMSIESMMIEDKTRHTALMVAVAVGANPAVVEFLKDATPAIKW